MEIQFAKWGNSVAFRVPVKVAQALRIEPGTVADLEMKERQLVITPRAHSYRLDDLLAGINSRNLHREQTTGSAVGAEVVD